MVDYARTCFVIMPFREKDVVDEKGVTRAVDFDRIYEQIFAPAIGKVTLPEGGTLQARRTDQDFFSSDISQDMFEYLEYSRIALTDLSGLNPNVMYELGVRHRARPAGTVLLRQVGVKIPFDINQIKAFPYEYQPQEEATKSGAFITQVLTQSLEENRIDSPVRRALEVQRASKSFVEGDLKEAENALRVGDRAKAIAAYRRASADDPGNNFTYQRLGLLLKDDGKWPDALEQFEKAIAAAPRYAEAWRERGIARNKLYVKANRALTLPNGIDDLKKAIELSPDDYDGHASLAGALKREGRLQEALAEYRSAADVSRGHSYPLLNALKLEAQLNGKLDIDGKQQFLMNRAARSLLAQVASDPPYDPPWSFFDLAEIRLYQGSKDDFLSFAEKGTAHAAKWQVETFHDSLKGLLDAGVAVPGMREGVEMLAERAQYLD
ncbi:MAG: tetratricopeptide repeat protein [Vicinamibacterales bacterium]